MKSGCRSHGTIEIAGGDGAGDGDGLVWFGLIGFGLDGDGENEFL